MARIVGVDLPKNKRGEIGLTYIYGIGRSTARKILETAGISYDLKVQAGRNVYGCYLEFDLNNPLHQFDKGLLEKNQIVLNVRWELKPTEWSDYVGFGSYSDAKYRSPLGFVDKNHLY